MYIVYCYFPIKDMNTLYILFMATILYVTHIVLQSLLFYYSDTYLGIKTHIFMKMIHTWCHCIPNIQQQY